MKKILIIANKDALLTQEIAESFNLNGKYDAISAASIDVVLEYTDKQKAHLAGIVTDIILPETNDNLSPVSFDKEPNGLVIKKKAEELGIKIKSFEIVYELIEDLKQELSSLLPAEIKRLCSDRGRNLPPKSAIITYVIVDSIVKTEQLLIYYSTAYY